MAPEDNPEEDNDDYTKCYKCEILYHLNDMDRCEGCEEWFCHDCYKNHLSLEEES